MCFFFIKKTSIRLGSITVIKSYSGESVSNGKVENTNQKEIEMTFVIYSLYPPPSVFLNIININ